MKITHFECWRENLELSKPYTIAYKTFAHVENFFVHLESENGLYGLGSGAPAEFVTGEVFDTSFEFLQLRGAEFTIGQDARSFRRILNSLIPDFSPFPAAMAALDIALHDLFCKYLDIPLVQYLGGNPNGLPTSVTVGIMDTEETLREVKEYTNRGFYIIKLKTGQHVEEDIERCRKIRESFGNSVEIRVDANQGYSFNDLMKFVDATKKLNIEFCEQPLPKGYADEMRNLPEQIRNRCAADEDLQTVEHAFQLSKAPLPFGIFNIKLMKCGGIRPAMQIGQIAEQKNIALMWGCMDESKISIAAALHAALASQATRYLDLDGNFDLTRDVATGGYVLQDGKLYVTERPGLGVQLK